MCPALSSILALAKARAHRRYPSRSRPSEQRRPGPKSNQPRRARLLWATWRRCPLVTGPNGPAPRSRLAIRLKALSRGAHGYFNSLIALRRISLTLIAANCDPERSGLGLMSAVRDRPKTRKHLLQARR